MKVRHFWSKFSPNFLESGHELISFIAANPQLIIKMAQFVWSFVLFNVYSLIFAHKLLCDLFKCSSPLISFGASFHSTLKLWFQSLIFAFSPSRNLRRKIYTHIYWLLVDGFEKHLLNDSVIGCWTASKLMSRHKVSVESHKVFLKMLSKQVICICCAMVDIWYSNTGEHIIRTSIAKSSFHLCCCCVFFSLLLFCILFGCGML